MTAPWGSLGLLLSGGEGAAGLSREQSGFLGEIMCHMEMIKVMMGTVS